MLVRQVDPVGRGWRTIAAAGVGLILVAGCSGGSSAGESSSPAATSATSTANSPTSSASQTSAPSTTVTSNATYAGAPGVPEEARHKTDAGAIAFAKYYLETVNRVGQEPKVGVLEPLALPSCKTCKNQQETIRTLTRDSQRFSGPQFVVGNAIRTVDERSTVVRVEVVEPAVNVLDASDSIVEPGTASPPTAAFCYLQWQDGWKLSELKAEA